MFRYSSIYVTTIVTVYERNIKTINMYIILFDVRLIFCQDDDDIPSFDVSVYLMSDITKTCLHKLHTELL